MQLLVSLVPLIIFAIYFIHFCLFIITNKNRINTLLEYVEKFGRENILTSYEYKSLRNRYTHIFRYMEFYPDRNDYKKLYDISEFDDFVKKSRKKLKYYGLVSAICIAFVPIILLAKQWAFSI
jgi:hypothetical protein